VTATVSPEWDVPQRWPTGKVFFSAFNGKLHCLNQSDLSLQWVTDVRNVDLPHNQPVQTTVAPDPTQAPPAAGWSSPVVVNGRVYVGIGEGENLDVFGFVYCLDANTGKVIWLYCTCQLSNNGNLPNQPNALPAQVVTGPLPSPFIDAGTNPPIHGCSVWSSIAYDAELNQLYCATGNPAPDGALPTLNYSNGLLALDADTGAFRGFVQMRPQSSYRVSDINVDIGGCPYFFY